MKVEDTILGPEPEDLNAGLWVSHVMFSSSFREKSNQPISETPSKDSRPRYLKSPLVAPLDLEGENGRWVGTEYFL